MAFVILKVRGKYVISPTANPHPISHLPLCIPNFKCQHRAMQPSLSCLAAVCQSVLAPMSVFPYVPCVSSCASPFYIISSYSPCAFPSISISSPFHSRSWESYLQTVPLHQELCNVRAVIPEILSPLLLSLRRLRLRHKWQRRRWQVLVCGQRMRVGPRRSLRVRVYQ